MHPPTHPAEGPHGGYNGPTGSTDDDRLVDPIRQLHIHQDRSKPSREARSEDGITSSDVNEHAGTFYVGYTFFKSQPTPGHPASWARVDKTRMNLSQSDLHSLVQKKAKRISIANQYQSLRKHKRSHVDELIEDLRLSNPQFHWMCVYVKEEMRDVRGRNYPRGGYETTSMHIILLGKSTNPSSSGSSLLNAGAPVQSENRVAAQVQHPLREDESFVRGSEYTGEWSGPNYHQAPIPAQIHNVQQVPVQFGQQRPYHSYPPPQHVMGDSQYPQQGPWSQGIPTGHPLHPPPVVHNYINPIPIYDPSSKVNDHGARGIEVESGPQRHGQEIARKEKSLNHQTNAGRRGGMSLKQTRGSEPDLVYDSSSSENDDILAPDHDLEDSEVEFSDGNTKASKRPLPWRGSLYQGYRTHQRKEVQRIGDHRVRQYGETTSIDRIPADSRHTSRRSGKIQGGNRGTTQRLGSIPRIIHQQSSSGDPEAIMNELLGRAQNNIRSRLLHTWQEDLEEREKLVEYQTQLLKERVLSERMDDVGFLGRSRFLREPVSVYPRGHLPRALH